MRNNGLTTTEKRPFLFYPSFWEGAAQVAAEERTAFIEALIQYGLYGKEPELTGVAAALFAIAKTYINGDVQL